VIPEQGEGTLDTLARNREGMSMSQLFSPGRIGALEIANRLIRTASHEGLADERGAPTDAQFEFYRGFVEGGIGLLITGYAAVSPAGKSALYHMNRIDSDDLLPAHQAMVSRIHGTGGRIVLQIAHCGRQTWSSETRLPLQAPSALACGFYGETPRALTAPELEQVVAAFAQAARRAQAAGYDGVQIHAAHGYLLQSFLARRSNRREDGYGGSLENRFRIVGEILAAVRAAVGKDYPVLIKLNTEDRQWRGITPDECVATARLVEASGCCDAIELSCGTTEGGFVMARGGVPADTLLAYTRPYCHMPPILRGLTRHVVCPVARLVMPIFTEGYNLATARRVKAAVKLPVITVGGMRSLAFMEAAVSHGATDFCAMARPLILEPDLPKRFREGRAARALCSNCNMCLLAADTQPIRCHNQELLRQRSQ
jgi:2,4-dienoyl-CoA reductase-like NADH-dependent reductase (Old Yellow Enzyme family)